MFCRRVGSTTVDTAASEPTQYIVGFGYYWQIRQDCGYEAVGANGKSVTIYPKEHLVIAVNSAGIDHHGIGLARRDYDCGYQRGGAVTCEIAPGTLWQRPQTIGLKTPQ